MRIFAFRKYIWYYFLGQNIWFDFGQLVADQNIWESGDVLDLLENQFALSVSKVYRQKIKQSKRE